MLEAFTVKITMDTYWENLGFKKFYRAIFFLPFLVSKNHLIGPLGDLYI